MHIAPRGKVVGMVSYDSLTTEFSLPQSKLEEECSEKVLRLISSKFTKWRNVAPYLELEEDEVEAIEGGAYDEEGKREKLLLRWKEKFRFESTYTRLIRCLLAAGRGDLARIVALEISEPSCPNCDTPSATTDNDGHFHVRKRKTHISSALLEQPNSTIHSALPKQQSSAGLSEFIRVVTPLVSFITSTEYREKIAKKEEKMKVMVSYAKRLEELLQENETRTAQLKQETYQVRPDLQTQQVFLQDAEEHLKSENKTICQLQNEMTTPRLEQDGKQKKCEHSASAENPLLQHNKRNDRLLQTQLQQANLKLEVEKGVQDMVRKQFDCGNQNNMDMEEDNTNDDGAIYVGNEHVKEVLEWAQKDILQEQKELEELKGMMKRNKVVVTAHLLSMVLIILMCIITCTHISTLYIQLNELLNHFVPCRILLPTVVHCRVHLNLL